MKTTIEEYTETILNIITDAMDNDLSFQWLKDKIEIDLKNDFIEIEKEQLEIFYCRTNKCHNNLIKTSAKMFYDKQYKTVSK